MTLGGATLQLLGIGQIASYFSTVGGSGGGYRGGLSFTLVDNRGTAAVSNTFASLAEGATFDALGTRWTITYQGGTGNDIVLTTVPEPGALCAAASLCLASALLRRRRRQR